MANAIQAKRVFVIGGTRIEDPAPGQPLEAATRSLSMTHPQFRWSALFEEDGVVVGDTIEYTLTLPPPKVNG